MDREINFNVKLDYITYGSTRIPVKACTFEEARRKAVEKFREWNKGEPRTLKNVKVTTS